MTIYHSKENSGFGAGHNFLAQKTNANYLLILNADLKIIEKDTVARLYQEINSDPTITVLGPQLVTANGQVQAWDHGHFIPLMPKIYLSWHKDQEKCSVAYVSGAVFLIRKSSFDQAGGFDPKIFLYEEEIDLCIRIQQAGGKIIFDPQIKVMHFSNIIVNKRDFIKGSMDYMIDKHYKGKVIRLPLKLINRLAPWHL